ncbi:MAG: aspartate kinase [Candidatus Brocadiia bacterium]
MKVLKFGGASLKSPAAFRDVARIIINTKGDKAVVLSALNGVTDSLLGFIRTCSSKPSSQAQIKRFVQNLKTRHFDILKTALGKKAIRPETVRSLNLNLSKLERLFYGVSYVEEVSNRTQDFIISFGERLIVLVMAEVLQSLGARAEPLEADKIGMITDGDFGKASAILPLATRSLRHNLMPIIKKNAVPLITGFFGCDRYQRTTTFGRGGSDYSASVVAYALDADQLEIWKDVDGFMSVSPEIVRSGHLLDVLSYDEAAEMAYFGAEILHPRMVEPAMLKKIPIIIRNTFNPKHKGTAIVAQGYKSRDIVKGIAYDRNIAILKIHGAGVGYKPGVLQDITASIVNRGLNIKSVITSQTCINILLAKDDLESAYQALTKARINVIEHLEKVKGIALVGIVGEGLVRAKGLAAQVFKAVADEDVNVEVISAGASSVAYYFIIKDKFIKRVVRAIYLQFFD